MMLTIAPLDAPALANREITARLRTCGVACRLELRSPLWSDAAKANFTAWAAMLEEAADEIDRLREVRLRSFGTGGERYACAPEVVASAAEGVR